jgi:hypothetical protein
MAGVDLPRRLSTPIGNLQSKLEKRNDTQLYLNDEKSGRVLRGVTLFISSATILTTSLFSLRRSLSLQGRHTLFLSLSKRTFFPKNCIFTSLYSTMSSPDMTIEDIESKISALTLLKSQKLAEAESKKSKKNKKKEKSGKLDVKVPKVTSTFERV